MFKYRVWYNEEWTKQDFFFTHTKSLVLFCFFTPIKVEEGMQSHIHLPTTNNILILGFLISRFFYINFKPTFYAVFTPTLYHTHNIHAK